MELQFSNLWFGRCLKAREHFAQSMWTTPGGRLPPNNQSGCWRKNLQKFLENSEFGWHGCATVQWAAPSVMRQTRNSPKPFRRTSPPGPDTVWTANSRRRGKILGELSIPGSILTTIAQMTDSEAVMNLLRKVPLFANLNDEDKVCIEETEEWRLPAGEMLFQEGQHGEHFFVLLEGEIVVWKHGDQEIVVARNRPGAFFGEIPLLLGTPHRLSARAECDCRLIVFPEEAFWKLLRLCPAISGEIFRAMVTRLRNIEGSSQQQKSWRHSERCPPALHMN